VEVDWKPAHFQPRCGHIPGNSWGRAFNTGVFAVRNSPAGRLLLARWRDKLLDPDRATVVTATNATLGITDQLALNMVLDATFAGRPAVAAPEDERVLLMSWAPNDTLRLHPLPVARFSSGHVAFVQRLPWRHGIDPFVVHATFQRYAVAMHQAGKRARFRQAVAVREVGLVGLLAFWGSASAVVVGCSQTRVEGHRDRMASAMWDHRLDACLLLCCGRLIRATPFACAGSLACGSWMVLSITTPPALAT
jgi:hypothetical protein